jgi:hypothetical protein
MVSPTKIDDKKWQAQSDLSTLIESEKICRDKLRYKAAMAVRKEQMAALEAVGSEEKVEK